MMFAFREMAQTQRAMIKSMKSRLPDLEHTLHSPENVRPSNHAHLNTHQGLFKRGFREKIGLDRVKSRPGKEVVNQSEIPQSWYEPVGPRIPISTSSEPFVHPETRRRVNETHSLNPLFEPTLRGLEDRNGSEQGY